MNIQTKEFIHVYAHFPMLELRFQFMRLGSSEEERDEAMSTEKQMKKKRKEQRSRH